MGTIRRLLGYAPTKQPSLRDADDDYVYPVHLLDNLKSNHNFLSWVMRFNDVLDADLLRSSLSRLLATGHWRKCGGRFRRRVIRLIGPLSMLKLTFIKQADGKYEVRVPKEFSAERPPLKFTRHTVEDDIENDPVAARLPQPKSAPCTIPLTPDFYEFMASEGAALHTGDLEQSDDSQLALHVTVFNNATIVSVSWPHTLMDVAGHVALMQSWSAILAGRDAQIVPAEDPLIDMAAVVDEESEGKFERSLIADSSMPLLDQVFTYARFLWDAWTLPERENRLVFLPRESADGLLANVRSDLAEHDKEPYLTEGDIIAAWCSRLYAQSIDPSRPVSVMQLVATRARIPALVTAKAIHLQNLLGTAYIFLSAELARSDIWRIALFHRQRFAEQTTEAQIRTMLHENIEDLKQGKTINLLRGPSNAGLLPMNNLNKIDYYNVVDFGPAVVKEGESKATRSNKPGSMVSWFNRQLDPKIKFHLDQLHLNCRDQAGNLWLRGAFRPHAWKIIEEELKSM